MENTTEVNFISAEKHSCSTHQFISIVWILQMRLDPQVELASSNIVPFEAFTTSDHTESEYVYYQLEDEKIIFGGWKCAPCLKKKLCLWRN